MMNGSVWLQDQRWPEVKAYLEKDQVILLPIASTEQHSLHLPLGTDSYVGIGLAEGTAKKAGCLVAPPIWYGWSTHHLCFPGTVTLRAETMINLVEDVCNSLIFHGFDRILIINGHRETNLAPLQVVSTVVRNETGALVVLADPIWLGATIGDEVSKAPDGGIGHADELECAHMLHLHPELVDLSKYQPGNPEGGEGSLIVPYMNRDYAFCPTTFEEFPKTHGPAGGTGRYAERATKETGEMYQRRVVDRLCAADSRDARSEAGRGA